MSKKMKKMEFDLRKSDLVIKQLRSQLMKKNYLNEQQNSDSSNVVHGEYEKKVLGVDEARKLNGSGDDALSLEFSSQNENSEPISSR